MTATTPANDDRKEYFSNYSEYNKTLRTWFVTFGIGGPLFLLSNPGITTTLNQKNALGPVALTFLLGCTLQILMAIFNKTCSWYAYDFCDEKVRTPNGVIRWLITTQRVFWVDVIIDIITFILFALATIYLFSALVP